MVHSVLSKSTKRTSVTAVDHLGNGSQLQAQYTPLSAFSANGAAIVTAKSSKSFSTPPRSFRFKSRKLRDWVSLDSTSSSAVQNSPCSNGTRSPSLLHIKKSTTPCTFALLEIGPGHWRNGWDVILTRLDHFQGWLWQHCQWLWLMDLMERRPKMCTTMKCRSLLGLVLVW